VQILREQLQLRELELARLKLSGADVKIETTKPSIKDSMSVLDSGPISTATMSTCLPRGSDTLCS